MISHETLVQFLSEYGYFAVFLVSLVEGPIVSILAAFLAAQGLLSLPAVFGTLLMGDIVGDIGYYGIGRWFRAPLHQFLSRHRPKLDDQIERVGGQIRSQPGRVLLFGKFTHATGFAILLAAGTAGIRFRTFFFYCILGTVPKTVVLTAAGYFFGEYYRNVKGSFQWGSVLLFILLSGFIAYVVHRWNAGKELCPKKK